MTYAGVLRDELNEHINKNRKHGDISDIVFLHTYLMLNQEWAANRVESTFTMNRQQIRTKDNTVRYIDTLKIDNKYFTIHVSQYNRCGDWIGLFVIRYTLKEDRIISRVYGSEIEVIVNSLDDMIMGIDRAINGDLNPLRKLLISCARGERRKDFYHSVRYGWGGFPAELGMNKVDPWSYYISGEEEMMKTLSDLEWELVGVMIRKDDWSQNEAIVTARTMVKNLGEEECKRLLAGDYKELRHKCIEVRYHEVNKEHGFDDNDLDAAETDESPLTVKVFE